MCHIILFLPVLTIPLFWLLPLSYSVPVYAAIVLVSSMLYRLIMKSMMRRAQTGIEGMIDSRAEVVSK